MFSKREAGLSEPSLEKTRKKTDNGGHLEKGRVDLGVRRRSRAGTFLNPPSLIGQRKKVETKVTEERKDQARNTNQGKFELRPRRKRYASVRGLRG